MAIVLHLFGAMKLASPSLRSLIWIAIAMLSTACGDHIPGEDTRLEVAIPVRGGASIGVACGSQGSVRAPISYPLDLYGCRPSLSEITFVEPMRPMIVLADCDKKIITVRKRGCKSPEPNCDTTWDVYADNTFNFMMSYGDLQLTSDGAGNNNCHMPVKLWMTGRLNCVNRDQMTIELESQWFYDEDYKPTSDLPMPTPQCQLPRSCYFQTTSALKQCI